MREMRVKRKDFLDAFKTLTKIEPKWRRGKVLIGRGNHGLTLTLARLHGRQYVPYETTVRIPGEGRWSGKAVVAPTLLDRFLGILPKEEKWTIETEADRMRVGTMTLRCEWEK